MHDLFQSCRVAVTVQVTKIGSPFGLFATHVGCVYVVVYLLLQVISTICGCSHLLGSTPADAVIPILPAKIVTVINNANSFFIILYPFPFLPSFLAPAMSDDRYRLLVCCFYAYLLFYLSNGITPLFSLRLVLVAFVVLLVQVFHHVPFSSLFFYY